jgi:hypothetical protein
VLHLMQGARSDIPGHQFGPSRVGSVKWSPDNADSAYQLRNIRYLYDNEGYANNFTTAFQVDGGVGSGSKQVVPLDTRDNTSAIIELVNTSSESITVRVIIYTKDGEKKADLSINLHGNASHHLITDGYLIDSRGMASVTSSLPESLLAVAMHYVRNDFGGIKYMYGVPAKESLGTVMRGSYNTFLNQTSELVLLNATEKIQRVSVTLVRSDGLSVNMLDNEIELRAHALKVIELNEYELEDNYGVVTVQPNEANSIVSWVNRVRENSYLINTHVRQ